LAPFIAIVFGDMTISDLVRSYDTKYPDSIKEAIMLTKTDFLKAFSRDPYAAIEDLQKNLQFNQAYAMKQSILQLLFLIGRALGEPSDAATLMIENGKLLDAVAYWAELGSGRWPELESTILNGKGNKELKARAAHRYAKNVI